MTASKRPEQFRRSARDTVVDWALDHARSATMGEIRQLIGSVQGLQSVAWENGFDDHKSRLEQMETQTQEKKS